VEPRPEIKNISANHHKYFFERRVSSYQVAVQGEVAFDQAFLKTRDRPCCRPRRVLWWSKMQHFTQLVEWR
jgi:hypothetical protein